MNINHIPVELLENIFKYLSAADILVMRLVCKLWRMIVKKELHTRKRIVIDFNQLYQTCLSGLLISDFKLFVNVIEIKFDCQYKESPRINREINRLIESLDNLERIHLTSVNSVPNEFVNNEKFVNLLERLDILTDICLNYDSFSKLRILQLYCQGANVSPSKFIQIASQLPNLEHYYILFLKRPHPFISEMLDKFSQSLHCRRLKGLALGSKEKCRIEHLELVKRFEKLESVQFPFSQLSCENEFEAVDIAYAIFTNPHLKHFSVKQSQGNLLLEKLLKANFKRRGIKFTEYK